MNKCLSSFSFTVMMMMHVCLSVCLSFCCGYILFLYGVIWFGYGVSRGCLCSLYVCVRFEIKVMSSSFNIIQQDGYAIEKWIVRKDSATAFTACHVCIASSGLNNNNHNNTAREDRGSKQ